MSLKYTPLGSDEMKLWAKNQDEKWANMSFGIAEATKYDPTTFRISVWTNVVSDADKSINAKLDVSTLGIFINLLRTAANADVSQGEYRAPVIEFMNTKWKRGENGRNTPDGTYTSEQLHIGKSADGMVWIALTSTKQGRPKLKFMFHKNKMRNYAKGGQPLTDAEISVLVANSFVTVFERAAYNLLVQNWAPKTTTQERSENNSGNSNSSGNNHSAQSSSSDIDDDIPF